MSEPLKISVHVEEKRYQPTQEKTVVPGWDATSVTPDKGYALSKVTVEGMPEPTESETFTENGTYDVGRIGTAVVDVDFDLQDKTVTPTEQTQMVGADTGYDGLDRVTVNPIPSGYVVPTGSVDITANGTVSVSGKATARVNVPIPPGYVIPSGSVDITANGQVSVAGKATANVNVPQGVFPSGTKLITENVTGEDVTNYAAVDVAVPGPSGTKQIPITANGTTTEDVSEYAAAEITVNTDPEKGVVFEDYDSDGYPHSARFVGTWTEIPNGFCNAVFGNNQGTNIHSIVIPAGCLTIRHNAFAYCAALQEIEITAEITSVESLAFNQSLYIQKVVYLGNVPNITQNLFQSTRAVLYDFSHASSVPTLFSTISLRHASGCVIRIPSALSDQTLGEGNGWESATNWSALTDIVWEVV